MGISSLRPFLRSLCCNSLWNYAMFWKIKDQYEKILVWEDSFCEIPKPRDPMLCPMEDFYTENLNKTFSSAFTSSVLDGTFNEVGLAVAEMASASHVIGKGSYNIICQLSGAGLLSRVVGQAALTGKARWVYSGNFANDAFDAALVPEYPDEWLLQFAAGIKTILLLPVLPHGVLQLGSVEMIPEDASFVINVKHKFDTHKSSVGYEWGSSMQHFSAFVEPQIISTDKAYGDLKAIDAVWTKDCNLSTKQMMPVSMVDLFDTSAEIPSNIFDNMIDSKISHQSSIMSHVVGPCQLLREDNIYDLTEFNSLKTSLLDEKARDIPYFDHYDGTLYGDFVNDLTDFHFDEAVAEPTSKYFDFDNTICDTGINFSSFHRDLELHKALEPAVVGNPQQYTENSPILGQNVTCSSADYGDSFHSLDTSGALSVGFMNEVEVEHLFEAVVANASSNSDDNSTNTTNVTSVCTSLDDLLTLPRRANYHKRSAMVEEDTVPLSFLTDSCISQRRITSPNFSASASSGESTITELTGKQQERKEGDSLKQKKLSRLTSTNKRRVRSGDNQKSRPRDRQLIQDRIKELREIVPSSGKCSIDGLLDKTVKHMLHLKSMTNHADKLRSQVLNEGIDRKITRTDEESCGHQNGTSWAVELGSEMQSCPIVVKDLDSPGHMLIEMLCNDFSRFLEITDVIHRSQLTILKGVMENSSDNSLARFIVEASGSFHRLDIFWPLMQLLQQNRPPLPTVA